MLEPDFDFLFQEIPQVFLDESKYVIHKNITDFTRDGEFLGDFFHSVIYELASDGIPLIHNFASPFDLITKKAPETLQTFRDGLCLLSIDYTEWVKVRTGIMDAILVRSLGRNAADGRVAYIGTGGTAAWSLRALAHSFPDLQTVDYVTRTEPKPEFKEAAENCNVALQPVTSADLGNYDFIFCHTNSSAPILTKDVIPKPGALITSFISSTENGEVDDSYYQTDANIILDWVQNLEHTKDLSRAVSNRQLKDSEIISLTDVLTGEKLPSKQYTVARFGGTPMQDLAVAHYLLNL